MQVSKLKTMAASHGWDFLDHQESIGLVSFSKLIDDYKARVNIYCTKMTVATCIKHPKSGKTQMFRKRVTSELMEKIFKNPRVHTGKGYRNK